MERWWCEWKGGSVSGKVVACDSEVCGGGVCDSEVYKNGNK